MHGQHIFQEDGSSQVWSWAYWFQKQVVAYELRSREAGLMARESESRSVFYRQLQAASQPHTRIQGEEASASIRICPETLIHNPTHGRPPQAIPYKGGISAWAWSTHGIALGWGKYSKSTISHTACPSKDISWLRALPSWALARRLQRVLHNKLVSLRGHQVYCQSHQEYDIHQILHDRCL